MKKIDRFYNKMRVPKFIYGMKRRIKGYNPMISPNEMITPNSGIVQWIISEELGGDQSVLSVGEWICENTRWAKDTNYKDYYQFPFETLAMKKGDCEDLAFLAASLCPELSVVFGTVNFGNGPVGHAWNEFIHEGEVWILDTVGSVPIILPYKDAEITYSYESHWVFTEKSTYDLGYLDFWDEKYDIPERPDFGWLLKLYDTITKIRNCLK